MINGILNIHKPINCTSYDVIRHIKKILPKKTKIGHAGTLDPLAEGVLPICLGEGTKLIPYLQNDKVYRATILFGKETDTYDITGKVINETDIENMSKEKVHNILTHFLGEQSQIPPMYSALKHKGRPLYKIAREDKSVERHPRKIVVYSIEIDHVDFPSVIITIHCSSGTYIRTLAHDLGKALETYACLSALIRLRSGMFSINNSLSLDKLTTEGYTDSLISLEQTLPHFPSIIVSDTDEAIIRKTGILPQYLGKIFCCDLAKIINYSQDLICIASGSKNSFRVERMFNITHQMS